MAATAVVGCGEGEKPAATPGGARPTPTLTGATPTAATKQPKRGGILLHGGGLAGSSDSLGVELDPHTVLPFYTRAYGGVYQGLVWFNLNTDKVEARLAQQWEQPSQTEFIFTLQPNVRWHNKPPVNGRELTVDDVLFSLNRARSNNPRIFTRALLSQVDKIEAVDRSRVKITTKVPDAGTLTKLGNDNVLVVPPELVDKGVKLATADKVIGTGPFVMKSIEANVGAEYERNPNYWRPGLPYLDGIQTRHFPDRNTAWGGFLAKQLHVTMLPGNELASYVASRGANFQPQWYPDDTGVFNFANVTVPPTNDPRVSRALRLLIDYKEFIKTVTEINTGRGRFGSIFPTALARWDFTDEEYAKRLDWKQPKDDAIKQALDLLNAAGFNRSNQLRIKLDSHTPPGGEGAQGAQLIQANWRQNTQGVVQAEIKLNDQPAINEIRNSKGYTFAHFGHSAGGVDPDAWFETTYRTGGSTNFTGFSDPKFDSIVDKQRGIFDTERRKTAIREIIDYMIDHSPTSMAGNRFQHTAAQPQVQNFQQEYWFTAVRYEQVWLDT